LSLPSIIILSLVLLKSLSFFLIIRLSLSGYGIDFVSTFSVIDSFLLMLTPLALFGFEHTGLRINTDFKSEIYNFTSKYFKISLIITLLLLATLFLFKIIETPYLFVLGLLLFINILSIYTSTFLRANGKILMANFFDSIVPILLFFFLIYLLSIQAASFNFYIGWLTLKIIFCIISIIYFFKINKILSKGVETTYKSIFAIAVPILIASFSVSFINQFPVIFMDNFNDDVSIVSFKIATKFCTFFWLIQYSFYNPIIDKIPIMFKNEDYNKLSNICRKQSFESFILILFAFLFFIFFQDFLFKLISPEDNLNQNLSIILCLSILLNSTFGPMGYIYQLTNNEKTYMYIMLTAFLLFVLMIYPVYLLAGSLGIAFLYLVIFLCINFILRYILIIKTNKSFGLF